MSRLIHRLNKYCTLAINVPTILAANVVRHLTMSRLIHRLNKYCTLAINVPTILAANVVRHLCSLPVGEFPISGLLTLLVAWCQD
jgi:hypothetical protein